MQQRALHQGDGHGGGRGGGAGIGVEQRVPSARGPRDAAHRQRPDRALRLHAGLALTARPRATGRRIGRLRNHRHMWQIGKVHLPQHVHCVLVNLNSVLLERRHFRHVVVAPLALLLL